MSKKKSRMNAAQKANQTRKIWKAIAKEYGNKTADIVMYLKGYQHYRQYLTLVLGKNADDWDELFGTKRSFRAVKANVTRGVYDKFFNQ